MAEPVQMKYRLVGIALVVVLASFVTGCGGVDDDSDFLKMGNLLLQQTGLFGSDSGDISRDQAGSVPYASIGLKLGSSSEALLVLATTTGDTENWQSGIDLAISTRQGRIVHTAGFEHNLDGFQGPFPDSPTAASGQNGSYYFLYDMKDMGKYGVIVRCSQHLVGTEKIQIIGVSHDTRHIVEDCSSKDLDWNFTNEFWQDSATGYVWKSVQNARPDIDKLTVETLRPEQ
jgi:hypothetical protein